MNDKKLLSISIIVAAIILAIPLGKLSTVLSAPKQSIDLPNESSIKKQIKKMVDSSKVNDIKYSIGKTKILLDVTYTHGRQKSNVTVIYEMDDFGRFIKKEHSTEVDRVFPAEIKK